MSTARERPLLVSPREVAERAGEGDCVIFDCRFDLKHPGQGYHSWLAAHIPGAVYTHLDDNLAGRVTPSSGRHPLPHTRSFASFLARSGWVPGRDIVAYDAHGGAFAARLWWLMKYFSQDCVRLLDGGIQAWRGARLPLDVGPQPAARMPMPRLSARPELTLSAKQVAEQLSAGKIKLVDARDEDRFIGRNEPIDPVAGHVPGACNLPFAGNLRDGRFRPPAELRARFRRLAEAGSAERVVHMCGSGVTACHNLFAMELAGLPGSRLYPGSWSEWVTNPGRPVATGPA